jgi:hypothetical protein
LAKFYLVGLVSCGRRVLIVPEIVLRRRSNMKGGRSGRVRMTGMRDRVKIRRTHPSTP